MNGNNCSFSLTNIHMFINKIIDVTDSSLKQKANSINFDYFQRINDNLVNFIYKNKNTRIIAVDGTYIPLKIINAVHL